MVVAAGWAAAVLLTVGRMVPGPLTVEPALAVPPAVVRAPVVVAPAAGLMARATTGPGPGPAGADADADADVGRTAFPAGPSGAGPGDAAAGTGVTSGVAGPLP
ncbi:hypothetical protein ACFY3N_02560 [Streptomyces sp. NPDC000348]|uniref:hypothetical protein n=1 Tax=Streptomyces sp. NPDC000348 TaxID=3364538 RepID=UPI0036BF7E87